MNVLVFLNILAAAFFGMLVFNKFRKDMKYELRDKSIEIRRKKLEHLYNTINV